MTNIGSSSAHNRQQVHGMVMASAYMCTLVTCCSSFLMAQVATLKDIFLTMYWHWQASCFHSLHSDCLAFG